MDIVLLLLNIQIIMETTVRPYKGKKEAIKALCDIYDKEVEEIEDENLKIKGENLQGLLDKIKMDTLGEIIN